MINNITFADIVTATATHTMIRIPTTAIETKIFLSMIEQWRSNQSVSLITLITKTRRVRFMLEVFYQLSNQKVKLITKLNVFNMQIVINFWMWGWIPSLLFHIWLVIHKDWQWRQRRKLKVDLRPFTPSKWVQKTSPHFFWDTLYIHTIGKTF